jgi:hypothetical protein
MRHWDECGDLDDENRRVLIVVRAVCQTAIDRIEPDDLQHELMARVHELCNLIDADLGLERR